VSDPAALRARLDSVRDRIAQAARRVGRDPAGIRLIAVSKTFSADDVRAATLAGQGDFGENKVQEALPKIDAVADPTLTWHLIGHLQSNKARKAASRFDYIHSVDSVDLLSRLEEAASATARRVRLLVQVDLAGEPTKHGARPEELPTILAAASSCRSTSVDGLMLLPPWVEDPTDARPYFRQLRQLRDQLASAASPLAELSMGMSHDFEVAIEEGATMVRIGSAIFGSRRSR
jgi:pyridoxal phosphate enzyme (YggS family)